MSLPGVALLCLVLLCPALVQAFGSEVQRFPGGRPEIMGEPVGSEVALCSALTPQRASALNVTFDPGTWTLMWTCGENVTVTSCTAVDTRKDGKPRRQKIPSRKCHCQFQPLTLHLGVTLEVNATVNHMPVYEKLSYVNRGLEGSAAQNVTCVIHDASVMTCTWVVGHRAPADVQYFLHIQNTTGHMLMECPTYLGSPVHTGCRLNDLKQLPHHMYVTVTGSSQMGDIMFYDVKLNTKLIVTWSQPQTWSHMTFSDFRYEVDIQRQNTEPGNANPKVCISSAEENKYEFPSPEPRPCLMVSVRAGDVRSERWSAWSLPVVIGSKNRGVPRLHVYLTVVTVTLLCALGLGLACKRFIKIQKLFPQIPEIKDKVTDDDRINPETLRKDLLLQTNKVD